MRQRHALSSSAPVSHSLIIYILILTSERGADVRALLLDDCSFLGCRPGGADLADQVAKAHRRRHPGRQATRDAARVSAGRAEGVAAGTHLLMMVCCRFSMFMATDGRSDQSCAREAGQQQQPRRRRRRQGGGRLLVRTDGCLTQQQRAAAAAAAATQAPALASALL